MKFSYKYMYWNSEKIPGGSLLEEFLMKSFKEFLQEYSLSYYSRKALRNVERIRDGISSSFPEGNRKQNLVYFGDFCILLQKKKKKTIVKIRKNIQNRCMR